MPNKKTFLRILVGVGAGLILLVPGLLTAWALKVTLNLEIAIAAIAFCVGTAIWAPKLKWVTAVLASLLIAEPPYPHWLHTSGERGIYFDFYPGYTLQDVSPVTIGLFFIAAMLLISAIYWALSVDKKGINPDHSSPN